MWCAYTFFGVWSALFILWYRWEKNKQSNFQLAFSTFPNWPLSWPCQATAWYQDLQKVVGRFNIFLYVCVCVCFRTQQKRYFSAIWVWLFCAEFIDTSSSSAPSSHWGFSHVLAFQDSDFWLFHRRNNTFWEHYLPYTTLGGFTFTRHSEIKSRLPKMVLKVLNTMAVSELPS